MKKFIDNKWHLHSLTFFFAILFIWYTDKYPEAWGEVGYSGNFLQVFLAIFCSAFVAFIVEWVQGKFFGANRTPEQVKESNWDMAVSTIAAALGVLVYYIYPIIVKLLS